MAGCYLLRRYGAVRTTLRPHGIIYGPVVTTMQSHCVGVCVDMTNKPVDLRGSEISVRGINSDLIDDEDVPETGQTWMAGQFVH